MSEFIRSHLVFDELDSTNDKMADLLQSGSLVLPALVECRIQKSGRGQRQNTWWSDEGSLTFSIGVDPTAIGLQQAQEPCLALASAVAIVDTLSIVDPTVAYQIRWPNDVEFRSKKIGGILVESVMTSRGRRLVVGIGLNVNAQLSEAPMEVQTMAGSVHQIIGRRLEQSDLLRALQPVLRLNWELLAKGSDELPRRWSQLDSLLGQKLRIRQGTNILVGYGAGIDELGRLRLLDDQGRTHVVTAGQVLRDS